MYLRYFSRKTDAISTIGKDLPDICVRWRRLLLRMSKIRHSLETVYHDSRQVITFKKKFSQYLLEFADIEIPFTEFISRCSGVARG
jgi:hypothetical protein